VSDVTRTLTQNAALWPLLECFTAQRQWPVNGRLLRLGEEEWKDVLSGTFAAETGDMRAASLIDRPGVVLLGLRTSEMTKPRFSQFLDFTHACASHLGVQLGRDE
jgi:hypothetical protein